VTGDRRRPIDLLPPELWESPDITALMRAIRYGRSHEIDALLVGGAGANDRTQTGLTPLLLATLANEPRIVNTLLLHGADPNLRGRNETPPLVAAVVAGFTDCAIALLRHGALVDASGPDRRTPLCWAAQLGRGTMAGVLIEHGANLSQRDAKKWTPLHWAAWLGVPELVERLVSGGALIDELNEQGFTALVLAADRGHSRVVARLLAAGASPNIAGSRGTTALILAAHRGHPGTARLLLKAGAQPNARDETGRTALIYASARADRRCVLVLLEFGADLAIGIPTVPPPIVRRQTRAKQRAWGRRLVFALSSRRSFYDLTVGVLWLSDDQRMRAFSILERALKLIADHDPRRFRIMTRDLKRILVGLFPGARGRYVAALDLCLLDSEFVLSPETTPAKVACVIVHEATHARLRRLGFGYTESERTRIERTCERAEVAFACKLSDADGLLDEARKELEQVRASAYTNEALRRDHIEALRKIGMPAWFIRAFEWWSKRRVS
jgi:ankyrin repeat protein